LSSFADIAAESSVMCTGHLRPSVRVAFEPARVRIVFGPWETSLPRSWVNARPSVTSLLEGRLAMHDAVLDPDAAPVAHLLANLGCFVPQLADRPLPLGELRTLFEPFKLEWYGTYYAHPVWDRLRTGAATRNELVAWIIHNYHVSRAAGIVAARMATSQRRWNTFFRRDSLEEFWHCDAYYFIDEPALAVRGEDVRTYVPLPASLAFEQLCTVTAETDALAHLLIAYFQESSIMFKEGSEAFYAAVERVYEIPGFFRTWRDHIQIDVEQGHSDGLRELFEDSWNVEPRRFKASLRTAWLASYFLLASLDDIQRRPGPVVALRHPARWSRADGSRPRDVVDRYSSSPVEAIPSEGDARAAAIAPLLRDSAFRALAFSRSHDEVMVAGTLARTLEASCPDRATDLPWALAVGNFLREAAVQPRVWLTGVAFLVRRLAGLAPNAIPDEVARVLHKYDRLLDVELSSDELAVSATTLYQLDELVLRCLVSPAVVPSSLESWIDA
jgi:hypothetical protein